MRQTGGGAASVGAAGRIRALRAPLDPAQMALPLALLGLLTAFILYPLIQVLAVAFTADGRLSLVHLRNFFARPLFREALGGVSWPVSWQSSSGASWASPWRTSG